MQETRPHAAHRQSWNAGVEASARAFSDNVAPALAVWAEGAVERAGLRSGARVLDVGCGSGRISAACALRAGQRGVVVGIDESRAFIEAARSYAAHQREFPRTRLVRATAEAVPAADASFDAVVSAFAMPLWDPTRELAQAWRVLRSGGTLSIVHLGPKGIEPMGAVESLITRFRTDRPSAPLQRLRSAAQTVRQIQGAAREAAALEGAVKAAGFESVSVSEAQVRQRFWGITNFVDVCLSHPLAHAEHAELEPDARELFVAAAQEELLPRMDLEEFISLADLVFLSARRP